VKVYNASMDPKIILLVPSLTAKLSEEIEYHSGRIDGILPDDADHAARLLTERIGYLTVAEFPLPVDPLDRPSDAVEAVAAATNGGHYLYIVDAWTEPSRGVRVPGRIVVRNGSRERTLTIPWEHGSPSLDLPTLLAGGLNIDEARDVMSRFLVT
jgi:hypothetical protein